MTTFAQFEKVSFKNVLVFKDEFTIPLSKQGVISVIGENKDTGGSNGAGKSTIFDILRAIHLGKVADGTPDIQFLSNKGSSYINYVASYGKNKYDITKYRNDKVYKNNTIVLKNDKPIGAKKNSVALRKEISESYIKLSEAVWDNCVVLRTDKAHTLLQGTPSDRIEFISNICQLNAYDELEDRLKENLKSVVDSIDELRETQALYADVSRTLGESQSKKSLSNSLNELESSKSYLTYDVSNAIKKKHKAETLSNKIRSLLKEVSSLEKYSFSGTIKEVTKEINEEKESCSSYQKEIEKLSALSELFNQYKSLKEKISKLNAPKEDIEHFKSKLRLLVSQGEELLPKLERAKEAKSIKEFLNNAEEYDLKELEKELSELQSTKVRLSLLSQLVGHKYDKCPLCKQLLKESIKIDEEQLKKDIDKTNKKIKEVSNNIDSANDIAFKKERLNKIGKYDYKTTKEEYYSNKEKQIECRDYISLKEKEHSYKEDLAEVKKKLNSVSVDVNDIDGTIKKYKDKLSESQDRIQKLSLIKETLSRISELEEELGMTSSNAEKELKKVLDDIEKYDLLYEKKNKKLKKVLQNIGEIQNSLSSVDKLLAKKEKYEKELEVLPKLEKKKKFLEALVYCYSNKGLKATKISKILEALSIRLQEYTSILFSEKDIEFEVTADNKSFSMMCIRKDSKGNVIAKYDAKRLSSGERARFTLALTFSLDDISSPNQRCNFKVLDEIDAKLDEKGKRVLLERFIPILKAKCDTLFIVSHDKEVRDSNIFDKKLIVTKHKAKSTIKIVEVNNVSNR